MRRNTTITIAVAGLVALCAMLLPAMAGAAITTGISGTVTNAEPPHAAVAGATVCLFNTGTSSTTCGTTDVSGKYEIEVTAGSYRVEFKKTGFVTQYYNEVTTSFEATPVVVTTNEVKSNINAKLEESGSGAVTGRVTNASNGQGATGVEVCVFGFEAGSHCAETNGNGEYTIEGLPAGTYAVNFSPANSCEEEQEVKVRCQPKSNYIAQSKFVTVKANKTETLNVALQVGGQIGGTATNASIAHPPIAKIEVCATKVNGKGEVPFGKEAVEEKFEYEVQCAFTNASGQYTINGLASGSYKVFFGGTICTVVKEKEWECPEIYVGAWFQGQQTLRKGQAVPVTVGASTGGVNESLHEAFPMTPAATAAPVLTGTPAAGQALTCSQGSWSHEPTYLVYQWLRNGTAISGQTGSTYTVQAADRGRSIKCSVTAGNGAGAVTAASNALAIPVPLAVFAGAKVKGANVSVKLICPGVARCSGVMKIVAQIVTPHGNRKARTVTIGVASFSIVAGKSVTVRARLTGAGRSALARSGRRGLKVKIAGTGIKAASATLHRHR